MKKDEIVDGAATTEGDEAAQAEPKARKLLLTKKVTKHFGVRTGVQAGAYSAGGGDLVCAYCYRISGGGYKIG